MISYRKVMKTLTHIVKFVKPYLIRKGMKTLSHIVKL